MVLKKMKSVFVLSLTLAAFPVLANGFGSLSFFQKAMPKLDSQLKFNSQPTVEQYGFTPSTINFEDNYKRFNPYTGKIQDIRFYDELGQLRKKPLYLDLKSDLLGCPPIKSDFEKVAEATDIAICFANKASYNRQPKPIDNKMLLKSDHYICECLREKAEKNMPLKSILNAEKKEELKVFTEGESREALIKAERLKAKENVKEWKQKRSTLPFQASIIFDGDSEASKAYRNDFANAMISTSKNMAKDILNQQLARDNSNDEMSEERKKMKEQIHAAIEQEVSTGDNNVKLLTGTESGPKQCVSGREYLAFRQLPNDAVLFEELSKATFNEDDWDYKKLKERYDEHMKKTSDEKAESRQEIQLLKSKLLFLNKNPMFKTFFSVSNDPEYYRVMLHMNIVTGDRKSQLVGMMKNGVVGKKKEELFKIMQKMAKGIDCKDQGPACLNKALKRNRDTDYKKALKDFFSNGEVGELSLLESNMDMFKDILSIYNRKDKPRKLLLTQEAVVTDFYQETQLQPDECVPDNDRIDIVECVQIFSVYCKKLDEIIPRLDSSSGNDGLEDDLDTLTKDDFNPDIKTNFGLRTFNDQLCNTGRKKRPSDPNEKAVTFFDYQAKSCSGKSVPECRSKYIKEYKIDGEYESFNEFIEDDPIESVKAPEGVFDTTQVGPNGIDRNWNKLREGHNLRPYKESAVVSNSKIFEKSPISSSVNESSSKSTKAQLPDYDDSSMGYNSTMVNPVNNPSAVNNEPRKIENMSESSRQDLLEDWKKEYEEMQRNQGSQNSSATSANEAAMKAKIEALEQLLAQQKKLTEEQYNLLNQAIAAQNKSISSEVAAPQDQSERVSAQRKKSSQSFATADEDGVEGPQGQASVKEGQSNTSGVSSGSNSVSAFSGVARKSGASGVSDNSADSVAREEAKLVNLRRFSDGSITIESAGSASNSANAITLPVSDEQYKLLQSNPNGLNLQQIEKSIPKEQIAKLEKNGEIIILLRNGSNPPFEVKVEKKNNKLVYRVTDKNGSTVAPVKRVFTRQALELQLKSQK